MIYSPTCFWSSTTWPLTSCTWAFPLCIVLLYGELIPSSFLNWISLPSQISPPPQSLLSPLQMGLKKIRPPVIEDLRYVKNSNAYKHSVLITTLPEYNNDLYELQPSCFIFRVLLQILVLLHIPISEQKKRSSVEWPFGNSSRYLLKDYHVILTARMIFLQILIADSLPWRYFCHWLMGSVYINSYSWAFFLGLKSCNDYACLEIVYFPGYG